VRWHSQAGPDVVANGLALCALHHALFDLGVLGLTAERRRAYRALLHSHGIGMPNTLTQAQPAT
jgi:predicted restriction endonuclease